MVTFADPYVYVRALGFFGTLTARVEEWGVGWKFPLVDGVLGVTSETIGALLETIDTSVMTFHQNSGLQAGSACFLEELTGAVVGTDGKYVGFEQETVHHPYGTPGAGASATIHPWSTAIAITHHSIFPRGKASKGRVYWPLTAQTMSGTTGTISLGNVTNIQTAYVALVESMNAAVALVSDDISPLAVVGQDTTQLPGGSAARSGTVVAISCGAAPDTQRRRDKSIPENLVPVPLPSAAALLEARRRNRHGS